MPKIKPPIEKDTEGTMVNIADYVQARCTGYGFAVLIYDFSGPGTLNYISNSKRADMIRALRAHADQLEQGLDIATTVTSSEL